MFRNKRSNRHSKNKLNEITKITYRRKNGQNGWWWNDGFNDGEKWNGRWNDVTKICVNDVEKLKG